GIGTLLEWKQNERDNGTYVIARSTSDEAISEIEPRRKPRDCFAEPVLSEILWSLCSLRMT
ncbi:MAG: hypothetical protein WBC47_05480, partial [Dehalococcoidia bacterium]